MFSGDDIPISSEGGATGSDPPSVKQRVHKANKKPNIMRRGDEGYGVHAQGTSDQASVDLFTQCVSKNMYSLIVYINYASGEESEVTKGNAIFVKSRVFITASHLFKTCCGKFKLMNKNGLFFDVLMDECKFVYYDKYDLVMVCVPPRVQQHQDLLRHFHTVADLTKNNMLYHAVLYSTDDRGRYLTSSRLSELKLTDRVIHPMCDGEKLNVEHTLQYRGMCQRGDCGGPVMWLNNSVQNGKILGIHIAGDTVEHGWSTLVSREFLEAELKHFETGNSRLLSVSAPPNLLYNIDEIQSQSKRAIDHRIPLDYFGQVPIAEMVRTPAKTRIIPTPLHGIFPVLSRPAKLQAEGDMNPLRFGITKQVAPLITFPQHLVEIGSKHTGEKLCSMSSPFKGLLLTQFQAINGINGSEYIQSIDMHTSPGVPYIHHRSSLVTKRMSDDDRCAISGKFPFVTGEPLNYTLVPYAQELLDKRLADMDNGIVTPTIFVDTLKDECRPLEKVACGNTRIFNVAPMDLNIALRMYFCGLKAHIMYNHAAGGEISIGINPDSPTWTSLAQEFYSIDEGRNMLGGDYSNYDKTLSYQVSNSVLRNVVGLFYNNQHMLQREVLFETITSAFHQVQCDIYRVPQGNPSGIAITSELNSLVNLAMLKMCYHDLCGKHGYDISTWDENVVCKVYGDDWLASVSDDVVPYYNMITIIKWFAQYNIKMTIPSKTKTDISPTLDPEDTIFLKRQFRWQNGVCYAPLEIESVWKSMNWMRECFDLRAGMQANYDGALRMMTQHGEVAYKKFVETVVAKCVELSYPLIHRSFAYSFKFWGEQSYIVGIESQCLKFLYREPPIIIEEPEYAESECNSFLYEDDMISVGLESCDEAFDEGACVSIDSVNQIDEPVYIRPKYHRAVSQGGVSKYAPPISGGKPCNRDMMACLFLAILLCYSSVNSIIPKTPYRMVDYCYLVEDTVFTVQQTASASIKIGFGVYHKQLVDYFVVNKSTAETLSTTQEENLNIISGSNNLGTVQNTQNEIISFSDAVRIQSDEPQVVAPDMPIDPYPTETLVEFLQRPYNTTFEWDSTMGVSYLIANMPFPRVLWNKQQIWDKLKNFTYFRANLHVEIRMNGTPFQVGQLMACWMPMGDNNGDLHYPMNNIYSGSGLPFITLSPSENETQTIDIPFALPFNWIFIERAYGGDPSLVFGNLRFYVLNPLKSSLGPTSVDFTVFYNFTDVKIGGYTGRVFAAMAPTAGVTDQTTDPSIIFATCPADDGRTPTFYNIGNLPVTLSEPEFEAIESQGLRKGVSGPQREQVVKSEKGVISGVAETVGKIAGALVPIPEIGVIASGVQMAAGVVGSIANMFGYSKPNSQMAMTPIFKKWANLANTHAVNESQTISMHPDFSVASANALMGSHDDDMTIRKIVTTPTLLFAEKLWQTADIPGTVLSVSYVSPYSVHAETAQNLYCNTLLSWGAAAGVYWRGSLRYHLQVVSSKMHSGRFRVFFVPQRQVSAVEAATFTPEMIASYPGRVVDIREETEISFTIPYIHWLPWLPYTAQMGTVVITSLNALRYPMSPSIPVSFNMYVSAGEDFQISAPTHFPLDANLATRNMCWPIVTPPEPSFELIESQGLTREQIRTGPAPGFMAVTGSMDENLVHGETIENVKDLLLRSMPYNPAVTEMTPGQIYINPYGQINCSATPGEYRHWWDYFRCIYRYARGSFDVKLFPNSVLDTTSQANIVSAIKFQMLSSYNASLTTAQTTAFSGGTFTTVPQAFTNSDSGLSIVVGQEMPAQGVIPYYATNYFMPNYGGPINNLLPPVRQVSLNCSWPLAEITTNAPKSTIFFAAGDDVQLGFIIGPPVTLSVPPS